MVRNKVQIYSEYTNNKYPLIDTHEEAIPFGLLVDAAIATPEEYMEVALTTLVRTDTYVYLSLETGEEPIAHIIVTDPQPFVIYPLTMFGKGSGWIVFGPSINETFSIKEIQVPLDPRCVMPNLKTGNEFKLSVNGLLYDMPTILNIETNSLIQLSDESRTYHDRPDTHTDIAVDNVLTMSRNDLNISADTLTDGMIDQPDEDPLYTINNIPPDSAGNVTISIVTNNGAIGPITDMKSGDGIGLVISTIDVDECDGVCDDGGDRRLRSLIQVGVAEHGQPYKLPLDDQVPKCSATDPDPEDPYGDCD
jgi:hypothetical protein